MSNTLKHGKKPRKRYSSTFGFSIIVRGSMPPTDIRLRKSTTDVQWFPDHKAESFKILSLKESGDEQIYKKAHLTSQFKNRQMHLWYRAEQ